MGYYSEWQLTICATDQNTMNDMLKWMHDYANVVQPFITPEQRNVMLTILARAHTNSFASTIFCDSQTKCYDPWSDVIEDIRTYVEQSTDLDFDYVRLGEDSDDIETITGKGYIVSGVKRVIYPPQISVMPVVRNTQTVSASITVQAIVAEEKCPTCKRMKDVGDKCWCCGN